MADINDRLSRCKAAIMGLVVADALGVPVEFSSRTIRKLDPVKNMRAFGTHNQPAGTWSDDSSMAVAAMEWYTEGGTDYGKLMDKFCAWLYKGEYTPYGETFDNGITVAMALHRFSVGTAPLECGDSTEKGNGNGSLMRILPTSLVWADDLAGEDIKNADKIYEMSALTHGHGRSKLGCLIYSKIVADMLKFPEMDKYEAVNYSLSQIVKYLDTVEADKNIVVEKEAYSRLWNLEKFAKLPEREIKSSGYILHTLEAAIWCLLTTSSYAECVLKAVNLGDDTDTVGAVAGGLAGLYYGMEGIPAEWIEVIPKKEWLMDMAEKIYG